MNLREAIESYANAVSNRVYYDDRGDAQRADAAAETLCHRRQLIDVQLAVAEAAIAYAEYQASNPFSAGEYFREQCKLWDAFIAARAKARDANQS